jgi:hypothetical protein
MSDMQWQPIETAPKREMLILYFPPVTGSAHPSNDKAGRIDLDLYPVHYPRKPTHWMPLPDPPK